VTIVVLYDIITLSDMDNGHVTHVTCGVYMRFFLIYATASGSFLRVITDRDSWSGCGS
jgi:hypothetical protein